jgi:hypothetical protein
LSAPCAVAARHRNPRQPTTEEAPLTRRLAWHPVGFAAFVVVSLWVDSAVSPFAAFRSLAIAVAAGALLWLIATLALRSAINGAFVASAVIGLMWVKQVLDPVGGLLQRMSVVGLIWLTLIGLAVILGLRLIWRRRVAITLDRMTAFLNRAAGLLILATLLLGLMNGRLSAVAADVDQGVGLDNWPRAKVHANADGQPDIYAIMLDGYPRADVLEYAFGWDNSAFLRELEKRGFDVATDSRSDYLWTHVSLPSALNLAYVEQIPAIREAIEGRAPQQPTLRTTVADNVAFAVAQAHGYVTVAVGAGFEELAGRRADVYLDGGQLNEFELTLLASTFLGDAINIFAPGFASTQHRDRISRNLEFLPGIAEVQDRGPTLVFAHVPAPHQPAVVDAAGRPVDVPISTNFYADSPHERGEDPGEFRERYRGHLQALNEQILGAIDGITGASRVPPVIVLFADHGSASAVDWTTTPIEEADPARLMERTGTLFAALTPGKTDVYPDDISPVDLFRLLYDAYFGTDYGRAVPPEDGGHIPPLDASVLDD